MKMNGYNEILRALEIFERTKRIYSRAIRAMAVQRKALAGGTYSTLISEKNYYADISTALISEKNYYAGISTFSVLGEECVYYRIC